MSDRSHFGGTTRVHAEATGFFRVEAIDARWWFITPDGHGFLSLGVPRFLLLTPILASVAPRR